MESNHQIILVPTDFTAPAECALIHAANIAQKNNDKVVLLHIINHETWTNLMKEKAGFDSLNGKLEALKAKYSSEYKIQIECLLREGSIFTTISEVADEIKASLVLMGTHGVKGVQHIIGAYALKVISSSKIPVIVVQSGLPKPEGYLKIVLPVDYSIENKQTTLQTIHFAKVFNAKVILYKQSTNDEEKNKHVMLNTSFFRRHFDEHGVQFEEVEQEKRGGDFSKDFIQYAKNSSADLIIILTTVEKDLKDFVIGPREQQIINNHEQIPVMCVNPTHKIFGSVNLGSVVLFS